MAILSNGVETPLFGYGTYKTLPEETYASVLEALKVGYRLVDTAAFYQNEAEVGAAVRDFLSESGLRREDVFVTSKLWNSERGYDSTLRAFDKTMATLGFDYLDSYLIHWPATELTNPGEWRKVNLATWHAFERLYKEGRIRSIGLSNFMPHHIVPILDECEFAPQVDQIEYHPGWTQDECRKFCAEHSIAVQGWNPLAKGDVFKNEVLVGLAEKYGVSVVRLILRWAIATDVTPLIKSVTPSRIADNFNCLSFDILPEDLALISGLENVGGRCYDPDKCNF